MKYSLIQVFKETDGLVEGVWIQDYTGELDMAVKTAKETEKANSNRIEVAVVEKTSSPCPDYSLQKDLKRLG